MFSKSSNKTAKPVEAVKPQASRPVGPSIISADMRIVGDLVSEGEIQVDGAVEGDIRCGALIVGSSGSVTGEINADSVRIHGAVTGRIWGRSVSLASTARMIGDIAHESLAIEPGAYLDGHCGRMEAKRDKPEPKLVLAGAENTVPLSLEMKKATG